MLNYQRVYSSTMDPSWGLRQSWFDTFKSEAAKHLNCVDAIPLRLGDRSNEHRDWTDRTITPIFPMAFPIQTSIFIIVFHGFSPHFPKILGLSHAKTMDFSRAPRLTWDDHPETAEPSELRASRASRLEMASFVSWWTKSVYHWW